MPIIEVRGLTHVYSRGTPFEKIALDHIDMSVQAGETLGLIGRTGSGKSTLIQHFNALLKPTEGSVLLDGADIFASKAASHDARFRVGLVFQYPEYQLFEETVSADIAFGPKNMRLSSQEVSERVAEAARFCGVPEDVFGKSPLELSGGQKRRVAIAGVLAMRPEVLVLDEPSAGLDPAGRESILRNILNWQKATAATVILVTHDMSAAATLCNRLVVLNGGHIAMNGTPEEVFSHSQELAAMGLGLPGAAQIALRLRQMGVPVPESVYTTAQLRDAVLALREGGAAC